MSTATQDRLPALSVHLASALGIDATPLCAPPLELWPSEAQCFVAGRRVDLSQREFDLLAALVVAPDRVIRRERLYELVWGQGMRTTRQRDEDCGCAYITPHDREIGQQSVDWTLVHTDQASKDFMRELPFDLHFEVGESAVHLVHGSPRKVNEYLFEDKPASLYERLAGAESDAVLVFGHTHKPWVHEYGGVLFVNCGSVGKPKDGDPRAAFAILAAGDGAPAVTIERVAYDAQTVAEEVREAGLPPELADKLVTAA